MKCPPFFVFTTKTTQPRPQVFSVNDALTCKDAAFLTSFPQKLRGANHIRDVRCGYSLSLIDAPEGLALTRTQSSLRVLLILPGEASCIAAQRRSVLRV